MKPNTDNNCDIVITRHGKNSWVIWRNDNVIANCDEFGRSLIITGSFNRGLSVFDADQEKWLAGDIGRLVE